ncbi:Sec63 Brl domain-containing protein [Flagelloscypha sp. PMI_526]|nr:Sec63 Brl domain-containing protein [Flagelloscypha sp. PMI_526]
MGYNYDESGYMSALFLLSFLALVLIPTTLSSLPFSSGNSKTDGCECGPCVEHRAEIHTAEHGSLIRPKITKKFVFLAVGWAVFAVVAHRVATTEVENKVYNPFEILGISATSTEKEIKSHFKQLSKKYHPDKIKATAEETIEMIQNRFVEFTKAYKSLTDETIRKNWEQYGNPDGRQQVESGIAIPTWMNSSWMLAVYGILFGGGLPFMVGKWWFGSRQRTKDGINTKSAAAFFTTLKEEATTEDIIGTLGRAYESRKQIIEMAGSKYTDVLKIATHGQDGIREPRRKALILLYSHLLRVEIPNARLRAEQTQILVQLPLLLNAFLTISTSRNWLVSTLAIMRLHPFLVQGLLPIAPDLSRLAQLPGVASIKDAREVAPRAHDLDDMVKAMKEKSDTRASDVAKAVQKWGRIDLVDAQFRVIGERIVTPNAIIFLVLKLRISPPGVPTLVKEETDVDKIKQRVKANTEKDNEFLVSKSDAEPIPDEKTTGYAHAPRWPTNRKPSFWVVLAEPKTNRLVVPPTRIYDVPYSSEEGRETDRDYRSYKIQFQGPNGTGTFGWKIFIVSDTFIGEEVSRNLTLTVDDVSALEADEQAYEDEISDPDEDTLEGQMALMKGGKVRKIEEDDDDDESTTDGDEDDDSDSDSDSD